MIAVADSLVKPARSSVARWAGVLIQVAAIVAAWDLPLVGPGIAVLVMLQSLLLSRHPRLWLALVPLWLAVVDVYPWTGRLMPEAFDFGLLGILGMLLWNGAPPAARVRFNLVELIWWLFAGVVTLNFAAVAWTLPPVDANSFVNYSSHWNALRAARPVFWAIALTPWLRRELQHDALSTFVRLAAGVSLSLCIQGVGILWERGAGAGLVESGLIYGLGGAILDFGTSYRATGLFSAMHTGGTALDAYLSVAVPSAIALLVLARRSIPLEVIAASAALFGTYAVMATFTRTTYFALVLAVLTFGGMLVLARTKRRVLPGPKEILALVLAVVTVAVLWQVRASGGYEALAGGVVAAAGGMLVMLLPRTWLRWPAAGALALVASSMVFDALRESRWQDNSLAVSAMLTAVTTGVIFPAGLYAGSRIRGSRSPIRLYVAAVLSVLLTALVIAGLGGARMGERLETTNTDLETRLDHWHEVLNGSRGGLLGNGIGSYPEFYLLLSTFVGGENYGYHDEGGNVFLRMGAGSYHLQQRLRMANDSTYTASVRIRSETPGTKLAIRFCQKWILSNLRVDPTCIGRYVEPAGSGEWETIEWTFETDDRWRVHLLEMPVTLLLWHGPEGPPVDLDDLEVRDASGREVLANGDFEAGGDRWFFNSDFHHLGWHIKNQPLHFYFELGWPGLLTFVALIGIALVRTIALGLRGDVLSMSLAASLVALVVTGAFGSPLDNPSVAVLIYIYLLMALQIPGRRRGARRRGRFRARCSMTPAAMTAADQTRISIGSGWLRKR